MDHNENIETTDEVVEIEIVEKTQNPFVVAGLQLALAAGSAAVAGFATYGVQKLITKIETRRQRKLAEKELTEVETVEVIEDTE